MVKGKPSVNCLGLLKGDQNNLGNEKKTKIERIKCEIPPPLFLEGAVTILP